MRSDSQKMSSDAQAQQLSIEHSPSSSSSSTTILIKTQESDPVVAFPLLSDHGGTVLVIPPGVQIVCAGKDESGPSGPSGQSGLSGQSGPSPAHSLAPSLEGAPLVVNEALNGSF